MEDFLYSFKKLIKILSKQLPHKVLIINTNNLHTVVSHKVFLIRIFGKTSVHDVMDKFGLVWLGFMAYQPL